MVEGLCETCWQEGREAIGGLRVADILAAQAGKGENEHSRLRKDRVVQLRVTIELNKLGKH